MKKENITTKAISVILILAIALLSMFVLSKPATSPESYSKTIQAIDEKKATVMTLSAAAATTATALAVVPSDATTPVANQIMAISEYLFIVVCFLVLEKLLLTVMGYLSFCILIPAACVLLIIYVFGRKDVLKALAMKVIVFAMVIVNIVPFSVRICDMIYEIDESTVNTVISEQETGDDKENSSGANGFIGESVKAMKEALDKLGNKVTDAGARAKETLNHFVDAVALFVITNCVVPLLVITSGIWITNRLFDVAIPNPKINYLPKRIQKSEKQEEEGLEETKV